MADPPLPRLMNFVSEHQFEKLDEARRTRGERVDDETVQRDKPLYEYEQQMANDEAQQLRGFQEAVAARASVVYESKDVPSDSRVEPLKKQKTDTPDTVPSCMARASNTEEDEKFTAVDATKSQDIEENNNINGNAGLSGLVSYSDKSEDDSD